MKKLLILILVATILRLYALDTIPGEMWGDVIEGYQFTERVLSGDYYFHYEFGGDGPLISYLFAPMAGIFGLEFYTMKLTTVLIGLIMIVVTYYLGKELLGERTASIAAFLLAVSKWNILFSRMAKPYILAGLFAVICLFFFQRLIRTGNRYYGLMTGISLGLGMYTQSAFWGVPIALYLMLILIRGKRSWKEVLQYSGIIAIVFVVLLVPFLYDLLHRSDAYFSKTSYIGEKMYFDSLWNLMRGMGWNLVKNVRALFIFGEVTFRNNPPGTAHLDLVSGIFFLLGAYSLRKSLSIWIPFFFFQIPTLLDINNPYNNPNLGRLQPISTIVFIVVACGIGMATKWIARTGRIYQWGVLGAILLVILLLNAKAVFIEYPLHLPNQNTPFGRIIARQIDLEPDDTNIVVVGCCWGEWQQPEPGGIVYTMARKRELRFTRSFVCNDVRQQLTMSGNNRVYLVTDPGNFAEHEAIRSCFPEIGERELRANNVDVATIFSGVYEAKPMKN